MIQRPPSAEAVTSDLNPKMVAISTWQPDETAINDQQTDYTDDVVNNAGVWLNNGADL